MGEKPRSFDHMGEKPQTLSNSMHTNRSEYLIDPAAQTSYQIQAMKPLPLLLSLSTLMVVCPLPSEASSPAAVKDILGRSLRTGRSYYILPVIRGRGGGLSLSARNGSACPLFVAQESSEVDDGLPLKFSSVNAGDRTVRSSTDLNVQFYGTATICVQSTVWRLSDVDAATGRRYVAAGGVKGNPGLATVSNWFKIEKYGRDYKLVFCPGVCSFCKVICGDVGVFAEGGKRWLGLSDQPFPVMFKISKS